MDDKKVLRKSVKANIKDKDRSENYNLTNVPEKQNKEVKIDMSPSHNRSATVLNSMTILDDISKSIPIYRAHESETESSLTDSVGKSSKKHMTPANEYLERMKSSENRDADGNLKNTFTAFAEEFVDVRTMETGLLNLLNDFHKGKLQAFGKDEAFQKMDEIRVLQEKVSRKHFELEILQQTRGFESRESREKTDNNISSLMEQLDELCEKIQEIHNDMQDHNKLVFPNHISGHRKTQARTSDESLTNTVHLDLDTDSAMDSQIKSTYSASSLKKDQNMSLEQNNSATTNLSDTTLL